MSLSQVQPGRRSEVRRDRAGDGDCMNLTSSSAAQRPYKNTHTHTLAHKHTSGNPSARQLQEIWEFFFFCKKDFSFLVIPAVIKSGFFSLRSRMN